MCINAVNLNKLAKTNCATEIAKVVTKPILQTLATDTISFSANAITKGFTKLSQEVSHRFPNKGYRVVSLPKGMEIVKDGFVVNKKVPTVAIVDVFSDFGNVKIGSRTKAHHGDIVTKYAVKGLEDKVGVLAFDATPSNSLACEHKSIRDALRDLARIQKENGNITALNLSLGESYTYEELNREFGLNLSPENIQDQKNVLLNHLSASKDAKHEYIFDSIQSINSLVDNGVKVYSSSGNTGDTCLNLFSLSKAQNIVSADDYSKADKALSTTYSTNGIHKFTSYYDEKGNLIKTTDGVINFKPDEVATKRKLFSRQASQDAFKIMGTSYSTPNKLNKDLVYYFGAFK
ncbi:MAG: hypothetical protein IJB79_07030 [Candidatus Gastranaerophilales bacterium]|nr:hypothetical protein [Candidatus Gastranaerophilales bacterium]